MSDIFSIIKEVDGESSIEAGIIESDLGKGVYQVRIGRRFVSMRSAVSERLRAGQGVVVNKTENGRYIVGSMGWMKTQIKKEFVVDV